MSRVRYCKAIFISLLGNSFEWYDFMVYAALAPVLAKVFFPGDGITTLLESYGTFAAGFLTRPFGALLFGYLGDHFGRRYGLLLAIGLMMAPTVLIGCLPTYATAGVWAPVLLISLRLLQGLAMSGEMPGCVTFLTEMAPQRRQTTITSLAIVASLSGMLIGTNSVWWLQQHFGESALQQGMWRIPFWVAGVLGSIIYMVRRKLPESQAFLALPQHLNNPVRTCLRRYWPAILQSMGCYAAHGIGFYFLMAFSLTYFNHFLHLPLSMALGLNIGLQLTMVLMLPLGGYLADHSQRRRLGLICLSLMIIGLFPGMQFLSQLASYSVTQASLGLLLIAVIFAFYSATLPCATAVLFPTEVRYTGVAVLNNTAMTIFGGGSPLLIAYLIQHYHSLTAPQWPMLACFCLSIVCFWFLPRNN